MLQNEQNVRNTAFFTESSEALKNISGARS
jgi:hypothetical protein